MALVFQEVWAWHMREHGEVWLAKVLEQTDVCDGEFECLRVDLREPPSKASFATVLHALESVFVPDQRSRENVRRSPEQVCLFHHASRW